MPDEIWSGKTLDAIMRRYKIIKLENLWFNLLKKLIIIQTTGLYSFHSQYHLIHNLAIGSVSPTPSPLILT